MTWEMATDDRTGAQRTWDIPMCVALRDFRFEGEQIIAGMTHVSPRHPWVERIGHIFARASSQAGQHAIERAAQEPRSSMATRGGEAWRLTRRTETAASTWRL